jgi:hypothetical protein
LDHGAAEPDPILWTRTTSSGEFSARSAYEMQFKLRVALSMFPNIYSLEGEGTLKVQVFHVVAFAK